MRAGRRFDTRLVAGLLMLLSLPFLVVRLGAWPAAWFEEGAYLQGARNLAFHGAYAVQSGGAFYPLDPMLAGAGPTVLLPAAVMLRLLGVGLIQGRLVSVLYALAAVWVGFHLADRVMGRRAAIVATALMIWSPWSGFLEIGRTASGQMASLTFVLLGLYLWWRAADRASPWPAVGAGAAFGLALLSDQMSMPVLGGLLLVGAADLVLRRRLGWRRWVLPLLVALAILAAWIAVLVVWGDFPGWLRNLQTQALATLLRPAQALANFNRLAGSGYLLWAVPAIAYGVLLVRSGRAGFEVGSLVAVVGAWLLWFVLGSIGWVARCAFVPIAVSSLLLGRLFGDATGDYHVALRQADGPAGRERVRPARVRFALALLPALAVAYGALIAVDGALNESDRSAAQVAAYVDAQVAPGAAIATWDWEIAFLSEGEFHLPPFAALDQVTRRDQLGAAEAGAPYAPASVRPDYVIDGPWSWATRAYAAYVEQHCDLAVEIGLYDLYACAR